MAVITGDPADPSSSPSPSQQPLRVLILGAGITGLSSALALSKYLPHPKPYITVFELRPTPSTIGGAVNLTPNALRYLDHLGVLEILLRKQAGAECRCIDIFNLYSGRKVTSLDFRGKDGTGIGKTGRKKYMARRVMRWELQAALLEAAEGGNDKRIQVIFGKRMVGIEEQIHEAGGKENDLIKVRFEDGSVADGDLLLGCDGIHSAVRNVLIEPERKTTYTGITTAMAFSKIRKGLSLPWNDTGLVSGRRGSFMASYFEETREKQFVGAIMETPEAEVVRREGWRVKGALDQERIREDILNRFRSSAMGEIEALIRDAGDWSLYPVFMLPPRGEWVSPGSLSILLGDAAHAMAPQGESTGLCIEDSIIFARAMVHHQNHPLPSIFEAFQRLRRPHIDVAYDQAAWRWETVRDSGWFVFNMKMWGMPLWMWWTENKRQEAMAEDLTELQVEIPK